MSIDYYNQHAQQLASTYDGLDPAEVHASWASLLADLRPGLALDVGAGTGRDARWLAGKGFEVVAVEPSDLFEIGRAANGAHAIVWHRDRLPALKHVRAVGYRFDLILVSAVWQHVPPRDRARAFRVLSELLNPGGLLVLTLRFGQDAAENAAREFHAVSREELEQFARDRALICRHWIEAPDLRREDVRWGTVVFQHPDDGSGGLSLLRHIIINDNKSATYKLGLLRVLSHIAEAFPGAVIARDDASVTIPLGLVGLCWLKQYKPLIIHHRLAQLPQAQQPSFAKDAFFALAGFADPDLHVGTMLSAERSDVLTAALRDACRLIQNMPAHYITWPGTSAQIFEAEYCSPRRRTAGSSGRAGSGSGHRRRTGSPEPLQGFQRINFEYLARFGTMRVPAPIWQSLGQYACWLEPVIVNEWLGLMRNWSRGVGEVDLIQPELFKWEEASRFTGDVRRRLDALRQSGINVPCTWTGRRVKEIDIDHAFPWSRWPNNDLWNLLPTAATVNRAKSDRLPTVAAFEQARPQLLDWWDQAYLAAPLKERFLDEVTLALPCLDAGIAHAPETIYTAMLAQRARIKRDQQLPDWTPKGSTRSL